MKTLGKNNKTIGKNIKAARERAGYSQLDLAKLLDFETATAISLIESDERKVSAENLKVIAKALHCDVKDLLGLENEPVDVRVALRADKDLKDEDREAILRFIELAKKKHGERK